MVYWFLLLSAANVVILLRLGLVERNLSRRISELETLINSLGDIVGAYIDAMEGDGK